MKKRIACPFPSPKQPSFQLKGYRGQIHPVFLHVLEPLVSMTTGYQEEKQASCCWASLIPVANRSQEVCWFFHPLVCLSIHCSHQKGHDSNAETTMLHSTNYSYGKTLLWGTLLDTHKQNSSAPFIQATRKLSSLPCHSIKMRLKETVPYSFPWCLSHRQFPTFSSSLTIHPTRLGLLSGFTIQPHPCWLMHGSTCYGGDKNKR